MTIKSKLLNWLPYTYFALAFLLSSDWSAGFFSIILVVLAAVILMQLYFQIKYVDAVIGTLMMLLSFWFFLAYASDFHKITIVTAQTRSFVIMGGLLVISNFVMSALLFRNAVNRLNR